VVITIVCQTTCQKARSLSNVSALRNAETIGVSSTSAVVWS
jgi:hypothetical protein